MKYAKMDLAGFTAKLAADQYAGAGGARRALGKSSLTAKELEAANTAIDKKFGGVTASTKAAQGVPAAQLKLRVLSGKKRGRPKGSGATAKPAKRGRPARAAAPAAELSPEVLHDRSGYSPPLQDAEFVVQQRGAAALGKPQPVSASYYNSAAAVITALKGASPLSAREQLAYDIAVEMSIGSAEEEARARVVGTTPAPVRSKTNGHAVASTVSLHDVSASSPAPRAHIAVPAPMPSASALIPNMMETADVDERVPDNMRVGVQSLRDAAKALPNLGPQIPLVGPTT
jgi:hypothetical protein